MSRQLNIAHNTVALDALRKIDAEAPEAPPAYQDWGGDTEQAESWGINAGLYRAATIARKAIARIEGHAKVEGEG